MLTRPIVLTLLCCLLTFGSYAQRSADVNRHVIIAFDAALAPPEKAALSNKALVVRALHNAIGEQVKGDPLDKSDYISLLHFGIGTHNASLDDLARPLVSMGSPLVWQPYTGDDVFAFPDWFGTVYTRGSESMSGPAFSMLTGAKPYSLRGAKSDDSRKMANHTYLILVTDELYNGNDDFRKEFSGMKALNTTLSESRFYSDCETINGLYSFVRLKEYPIQSRLKAIVFEVLPAAAPSIGALDFPANYNMHRERGGMVFDFDVRSYDPLTSMEAFEIEVLQRDGTVATARADANGHVFLSIPCSDLTPDSVAVTARAWIGQKDSQYDGMILSPYDASSGTISDRLVSHRMLLHPEGGKVFGATLPDWLWIFPTKDVNVAALGWEILIVMLVIAILAYSAWLYNRKTQIYDVADDEITLEIVPLSTPTQTDN